LLTIPLNQDNTEVLIYRLIKVRANLGLVELIVKKKISLVSNSYVIKIRLHPLLSNTFWERKIVIPRCNFFGIRSELLYRSIRNYFY